MNLDVLISECINKNPKAERELYYLYAKRVFGICRRYTEDNAQAKDYMQESFTKVFSNLNMYQVGKSAFSTWVSSITVYTILSDKNKKRIKFKYTDISLLPQQITTDSEPLEIREEIAFGISPEELLAAIRLLPNDYRNIINLYVFESWKHADIAALLNIEVSSSRSKLTRAKQQLKKVLLSKIKNNNHGKLA